MTAQIAIKLSDEITKAIKNYDKIIERATNIERAKEQDPARQSEYTRCLLYALREHCIPLLKKALEDAYVQQNNRKVIENSIEVLKRKVQSSGDIQEGDGKIDESPLVLLLYLAIEKGAISVSRDSSVSEENWGRLGGIPEFLKMLEFEDFRDQNYSTYWPGLPTCLMAFFPISASEKEVDVSICAAADRFTYSKPLQMSHYTLRHKRIKELRKHCDPKDQGRIEETIKFSYDLRGEGWAQRTRYAERDSNQATVFALRPYDLNANSHVPVHLPIVVSTWSPDGTYKRACLLDSLRFSVLRPPAADEKEQVQRPVPKGNGSIPTETSCAEWHGFIKLMSQAEYQNRLWY